MALQLGDTAPDFEADTTKRIGVPRLDRRLVDRPVLTPKGLHSGLHDHRLHGEDQAGVRSPRRQDHRPLGRSDGQAQRLGERHRRDARACPNYPLIADVELQGVKLYGMFGSDVTAIRDRTAADNQTGANVFVIGPDKKVKLIFVYPMTTGRSFDQVLRVVDWLCSSPRSTRSRRR